MEKASVSLPFLFDKNISERVLNLIKPLHQMWYGAVSYNRLDVSGEIGR